MKQNNYEKRIIFVMYLFCECNDSDRVMVSTLNESYPTHFQIEKAPKMAHKLPKEKTKCE